jgi:hypothetical protein
MTVLLGEVGGVEEYDVCEALKDGRISKPLVAWCIGTCAGVVSSVICIYGFKKKLTVKHSLINDLSSKFCLFALHFINKMIFSFNISTNQFYQIIKYIDASHKFLLVICSMNAVCA